MNQLEGKFNIKGRLEESIKLNKTLVTEDVLIGNRFFQVLTFPVKENINKQTGDVIGGGAIFHDVSKEKEVEKMREDFTSMIVHELRSPLDGIKKMGELLRADDSIRKEDKSLLEYVGMIYDSSSNMLELVNDLLDVAKIESGKFEISKKESSITDLLLERIRLFDTIALLF